MNLPYESLPAEWLWIAGALFGVAIAWVLWRAPWSWLREREHLHVFLGYCVALLLMWSIRANAIPGFEYHYLGATLATLMFGWRLACVALSLVLAGTVLNGASDWQAFPVNALTMVLTPVLLSHAIFRIVDTRLPNNIFVYIFVCGYFGAGAAVLGAGVLTSVLLVGGGVRSFERLAHDYFPFAPLMFFMEAFISGMLVAIFVVMRPNWVSTFDDARYLKRRR